MPINLVKKQYRDQFAHHAQEEITEENWAQWLLDVPKQYRLDAYQVNFDRIPDDLKFEIFAFCYTSSEYSSQLLSQQGVKKALSYYPLSENYVPLGKRLEKQIDPNGMIRIFRGTRTNTRLKPRGMSWTLDKSVAEWFAKRFQTPDPTVVTGSIHIDHVLGYFENRREQEIIALPRDVTVIRCEQLAVAR